ncbi:MAG: decarboxylase, partial [Pseudomonadota bacterium]
FFDRPALMDRMFRFKETFSRHFERFQVFYALKSNSFSGIRRSAPAAGFGLDVSSGLELSMALSDGCGKIIFSGPGKTDEELGLALQNRGGVTLLLDSIGEFHRLSEILKREAPSPEKLRLGVRVRAASQGRWNKFGIPLKDLSTLLRRASSIREIELSGIQFHTSWNLEPGPQIEMIARIGNHIRRHVPVKYWPDLKFLDIGGGFWPENGEWLQFENTSRGKLHDLLGQKGKSPLRHYCREAKPLDDFAAEIASELLRQGPPLSDLEIWTEPGRWISTPAMHILLKVVDEKDPGRVILDGGTNLLGWERPLSEYIPVINLSKPSIKETPLLLFGSLCTPYDVWGTSIFGTVKVGDILMIPDQGAYTYSLRQSFIKPLSRVVRFDGKALKEVEEEQKI